MLRLEAHVSWRMPTSTRLNIEDTSVNVDDAFAGAAAFLATPTSTSRCRSR